MPALRRVFPLLALTLIPAAALALEQGTSVLTTKSAKTPATFPATLPIDLATRAADTAKDPLPFVAGSWTLPVVGDLQHHNDHPQTKRYPIQKAMLQWIITHKAARNIAFVITTGDTTNANTPEQWANAKAHLSLLDGELPYVIPTGNHDVSGGTKLNTYFKAADNPLVDPAKGGALGGTYQKDRLENAWFTFTVNGKSYILISLEYGARNAVVEWADKIVAQHHDKRAILLTHVYLYHDDTRYHFAEKAGKQQWAPKSAASQDRNDGEDLWQKLVKKHPNFILVISGHVLGDELGYLASKGDHGNTVHQILYNRQNPSDGQFRLMEFLPDNKTIQVKTYNPVKDAWARDIQNEYILNLEPANGQPASRPAKQNP